MGSRRTITAAAAGITALALVTAGCSGGGKPAAAGNSSNPGAGNSPTAATPDVVAKAFLAAWASGDYVKAASYTDDAARAAPRLAAVMKSLAPSSVQLTLGSEVAGAPPSTSSASPGAPSSSGPASTGFNFHVVDTFDNSPALQWTYDSALSVVPATGSTPPLVHWASAVINPQLSALANLTATPPPVAVADDKGVLLSATAHPSLSSILAKLAVAKPAGATAPTTLIVQFVDLNTGNPIPGATQIPLGAPVDTTGLQLDTTLDTATQTAAEQAISSFPESGMVVIRPSSGAILAIASNSKTSSTLAYHAIRAPGSTFKTISAAALLTAGMKPTDPANCTPTAQAGSQTYHNDEGLKNGFSGATLLTAYEMSCNTSFVNSRSHLSGYSALANEAKNYFGLNQPWDLGMGPATYCTTGDQQVPPANGDDLFGAEMFGQGTIEMCPLTMASVAATVASGTFKQPVLVPGLKQVPATPIPADVDSNLQMMMRGVITNGTATSLQGISPTLGGKTGSAEHDGQSTTDSWMIAMDPQHDVAVACLVLNAGFGNSAAGPAIAKLLKAIGG